MKATYGRPWVGLRNSLWGGLIGSLAGAFGGWTYGVCRDAPSGLDGALLGSLVLALGGGLIGVSVGTRDPTVEGGTTRLGDQ